MLRMLLLVSSVVWTVLRLTLCGIVLRVSVSDLCSSRQLSYVMMSVTVRLVVGLS